MSDQANTSYVDSEILKHENKWVARTNKIKDDLSTIIQKDRHDSKNRDQALWFDISENKEWIALHHQGQKFMEEKVANIERHLSDWISEIKQIIKDQASTFATKDEHKANSVKIDSMQKKQDKWDKWFFWFLTLVWTAIIWALLKLILING